jgi:hypothetical protein
MLQFLLQILFVTHAVNGLAFFFHVLFKGVGYSASIGFPFRNAQPQIEKIASFSSLIQGPQLGREQFLLCNAVPPRKASRSARNGLLKMAINPLLMIRSCSI